MAKYTTLCLRLVVRIKELNLEKLDKMWKVRHQTKHVLLLQFGTQIFYQCQRSAVRRDVMAGAEEDRGDNGRINAPYVPRFCAGVGTGTETD